MHPQKLGHVIFDLHRMVHRHCVYLVLQLGDVGVCFLILPVPLLLKLPWHLNHLSKLRLFEFHLPKILFGLPLELLALLSLLVQRRKHPLELGGEVSHPRVLDLEILFTGHDRLVLLRQLCVISFEFVDPVVFLGTRRGKEVSELLNLVAVLVGVLLDRLLQVMDLKALLWDLQALFIDRIIQLSDAIFLNLNRFLSLE